MISVVILTKNSSKTIEKTLDSIIDFDEVIIYDNGSEDNTLEIVKNYKNVKIYKSKFIGFGALRNEGSKKAKNDWILALDSDEVLSDSLKFEILNLKLDENIIYSIKRDNYYKGKLINFACWQSDIVKRLYNRKKTGFHPKEVHETLMVKDLKIKFLKNPIYHTPYLSISDFLKKMDKYSTLFAIQNKNKKSSSVFKALFHALFTFFKCYFIKKGIFGGKIGFEISIYNANTAFYKYLKLLEYNKEDKYE
jgi:glycosyltransferase involved in cell wall biosynthesis